MVKIILIPDFSFFQTRKFFSSTFKILYLLFLCTKNFLIVVLKYHG